MMHETRDGEGKPDRGLAIVMNGVTPYNVHLARRIAREIDELRLSTIFTVGMKHWKGEIPSEINAAFFSDRPRWAGVDLRDIGLADEMFDYLRRERACAVVLAGYASFLHLRLFKRLNDAKIPVFLRGDSNIMGDSDRWLLGRWFKHRALKWVLDRCDGVMPFGQFGQRYFKKYGADLSRIYLVPHECDYQLFQERNDAELNTFRETHGLTKDRRYLLSCSRLVRVKRVDLLIDGFSAVADEHPEWDLLIVGDGPLRKRLRKRVPKSLRDRVRWLGLFQGDDVRSAYQVADAFVLASDYEPWAVVINEAAAAGLVIVASDVVGAAKELVRDGVNGRIFRSGKLADLTAALSDVLDPEKYPGYQRQMAPLLQEWRAKADPIEGIRAALRDVGVL